QQRETSQCIRVLTADERSDAADVSLRRAKIGRIAIGPGELFRPGRNEFAMAVQQGTVAIEEKIRVPHGSHADGTFFSDPDRENDAMTLGNVAQSPRVGAGNFNSIF